MKITMYVVMISVVFLAFAVNNKSIGNNLLTPKEVTLFCNANTTIKSEMDISDDMKIEVIESKGLQIDTSRIEIAINDIVSGSTDCAYVKISKVQTKRFKANKSLVMVPLAF